VSALDLVTLRNDYVALREGALSGYAMPELTTVTIEVETEIVTDRQSAGARVTSYEAKHIGWCRRESFVGTSPIEGSGGNDQFGPPLDGEWRLSGLESIRLVFGGNVWRFIHIREVTGGPTPTSKDVKRHDVLAEEVRLIGKLKDESVQLRYVVYWGAPEPNDASGIRRMASRFVGFEPTRGPRT